MNNLFCRKPLFSGSAFPYALRLPPGAESRKNKHVETLRGLAIILVVFGHMIGYTDAGGMKVSDDSVFRYLYYSVEYIRLPLFTVISGWVYASKPVLPLQVAHFITGKVRRLLIPMFIISTLLFVSRMFVPGTNTTPDIKTLPRNLVLPYDVYWYLFSLLLIFLVIALLDKGNFLRKIQGWALAVAASFGLLFVSENFLDAVPNFFSFKGAAYLLPFFLLGIGIFRYGNLLLNNKITAAAVIIFIASVVIQQLIWFGGYELLDKASALGMTVGICGALLLFRLKLKHDLLIWVGNYAYGIFLFHVFFTGGTRILLEKTGIDNPWIMLISGVTLAILSSIALVILIQKSSVLRFYLLGLKNHEK